MGDEQGSGGIGNVLFLDENHCRNPHLIAAIEGYGIRCEKHLDHFSPGIPDTEWLSWIARHGWPLLTTDARIRRNQIEREAVRANGLRMFYFSRNNLRGAEMGAALRTALPEIARLAHVQPPPFAASISRRGEVVVRVTFGTPAPE